MCSYFNSSLYFFFSFFLSFKKFFLSFLYFLMFFKIFKKIFYLKKFYLYFFLFCPHFKFFLFYFFILARITLVGCCHCICIHHHCYMTRSCDFSFDFLYTSRFCHKQLASHTNTVTIAYTLH